MELRVKANGFDLSERLKLYAESKVSRLERFFNHILYADVEFTEEARGKKGNSKKVEVTLKAAGRTVRAEVMESSFYTGVDVAVDKLERQLKKYKTKLEAQRRSQRKRRETLEVTYQSLDTIEKGASVSESVLQEARKSDGEEEFQASTAGVLPEEGTFRIVRRKTFSTKPMTWEEAALQLELSGHPFFLFVNAETSQVNALFKREAGGYGLLEPKDD